MDGAVMRLGNLGWLVAVYADRIAVDPRFLARFSASPEYEEGYQAEEDASTSRTPNDSP